MSDDARRPPQRTPARIQWADAPPGDGPAEGPARPQVAVRAGTVPPEVRAAQARAMAAVGAQAAPPPPKPVERPDFFPLEARSFEEAGVDPSQVLMLVLRSMLGTGALTGRALAESTGLGVGLIRDALDQAKQQKWVNYRSATALGDYVTELTEGGTAVALQSRQVSQYVGTAPVPYSHYLEALKHQSVIEQTPGPEDLQRARW